MKRSRFLVGGAVLFGICIALTGRAGDTPRRATIETTQNETLQGQFDGASSTEVYLRVAGRGEQRHALARVLFFGNQGEFRTGDYEEIMNKASCPSLLSNAVLVWNTVQIARIVESLRAQGHAVCDEDVARISPLMHGHVIPNGTYRFDLAPTKYS
jgi:hypothetical protein